MEHLAAEITAFDDRVAQLAKKYPEVAVIAQPKGVGTLTALVFLLTLEHKTRFAKSRSVGAFIGLHPKKDQAGDSDKQLGITKTGDAFVRRLAVGSANYILGPFGEDSDLRRWGLALAQRGGKNAKKRAKVAVARKLVVLMHRLWVTGEAYQPLGYRQRRARLPEDDAWRTGELVTVYDEQCTNRPVRATALIARRLRARWTDGSAQTVRTPTCTGP